MLTLSSQFHPWAASTPLAGICDNGEAMQPAVIDELFTQRRDILD